jgi:DNA-directed RNA polymerase alpha subunit
MSTDLNLAIPKISSPANNALNAAKINNLRDVAKHSEQEIAQLHGMGPKGIRILKQALAQQGLEFRK